MTSLRQYNLLYNDTHLLARDLSIDRVFDVLGASLLEHVARHARRRLFVRAAVVAWQDRAIILVARPSAGTTHLVAGLCSEGARPYSDMFAALDSKGRVHAYAATPNGAPNARSDAKRSHTPLPVSLIVDATYRKGARWRPRTLGPGQTAFALLQYVVPGRAGAAFALRTLRRVAERAVMLEGNRGEARDMTRCILDQLDT